MTKAFEREHLFYAKFGSISVKVAALVLDLVCSVLCEKKKSSIFLNSIFFNKEESGYLTLFGALVSAYI